MEDKNWGTKETFYVLKRIKSDHNDPKKLLRYVIEDFFSVKEKMSSSKEDEILHDIARWGGFEIKDTDKDTNVNGIVYYLSVDWLRINEIYEEHKNLFITGGNNKPKFPYKLPAGTIWENIIIKFLEGDAVYIKAKQYIHNTNYKEMGLVGKGKNPKPSVIWEFLEKLSHEKDGEMIMDNDEKRRKYEKQKELLSKFLKYYFTIDLDPFFPYGKYRPHKHDYSYKIRLKLIPMVKKAPKKPISYLDFSNNEENDVKKFYNEQIT